MSATLKEIRQLWKSELLKDVRAEINAAIEPLKNNVTALTKKFNDLEESYKFLSAKYDTILENFKEIKKNTGTAERRLDEMYHNIGQTKYDMDDLYTRVDDLEQYGRRDTLEIQGIPVIPNDNPTQFVIEAAKLTGVNIQENDISVAHRLKSRKQGQAPIIVKFARRSVRDKIFNNRKNLKTKKSKDLPSISSQPQVQSQTIYINESLTFYRKQLLKRATEFKKHQGFKYLWTSNGKIKLRQSDTSDIQAFSTSAQFDDFLDGWSQF